MVVSAPGKRWDDDVKITDLLYRCHQEARAGGSVAAAFAPVASRFRDIVADLRLGLDLEEEFHATVWAMERGGRAGLCASRANISAPGLWRPFWTCPSWTRPSASFDENGRFDGRGRPKNPIGQAGRAGRRGDARLYGGMPDGAVATFSRGGSDISGAILARATASSVYENWTDVSGVLAADPW